MIPPRSAARWVVVVTGATSGVGLSTADTLVRLGAKVIGVGRSPERIATARHRILDSAPEGRVEFLQAELSSIDETRRLAAELARRFPELNVLVNNAGAYFARRAESRDRLEMTYALNVLSPFLLTSLLADLLSRNAPSRVVNVASEAHRGASLDLAHLETRTNRYSGLSIYGQSKLALILLTREFARRYSTLGVTVNAVHPGFVRTRFGQNNRGAVGVAFRLATLLFGISATRGARTPTFLATSPEVAGVTGQYFAHEAAIRSSPESYDPATAQQLWQICAARAQLPG